MRASDIKVGDVIDGWTVMKMISEESNGLFRPRVRLEMKHESCELWDMFGHVSPCPFCTIKNRVSWCYADVDVKVERPG